MALVFIHGTLDLNCIFYHRRPEIKKRTVFLKILGLWIEWTARCRKWQKKDVHNTSILDFVRITRLINPSNCSWARLRLYLARAETTAFVTPTARREEHPRVYCQLEPRPFPKEFKKTLKWVQRFPLLAPSTGKVTRSHCVATRCASSGRCTFMIGFFEPTTQFDGLLRSLT